MPDPYVQRASWPSDLERPVAAQALRAAETVAEAVGAATWAVGLAGNPADLGDTIGRQIADADLIVLNKTDLVPDVAPIERWLGEQAPRVRVVRAQRAQVPLEILLGIAVPGTRAGPGYWTASASARAHCG